MRRSPPTSRLSHARRDDIVSGGMMFSPPRDSPKPLAIIWIHGWGVNFYEPAYVAIGRALAQQGLHRNRWQHPNARSRKRGDATRRASASAAAATGAWRVRDLATSRPGSTSPRPTDSSRSSSRVIAPVGERCAPSSRRRTIRGSSASCSPPALCSRRRGRKTETNCAKRGP